MAMVNKIKKGNVEKDIHDTRIPELTGEEGFCVPFVNEDGDAFQLGSLPSNCLDNGSVTTEKVADDAVTLDKLGTDVLSKIPGIVLADPKGSSVAQQCLRFVADQPVAGDTFNIEVAKGDYDRMKSVVRTMRPCYAIFTWNIDWEVSSTQYRRNTVLLREVDRETASGNADDIWKVVLEGDAGGYRYTITISFAHMKDMVYYFEGILCTRTALDSGSDAVIPVELTSGQMASLLDGTSINVEGDWLVSDFKKALELGGAIKLHGTMAIGGTSVSAVYMMKFEGCTERPSSVIFVGCCFATAGTLISFSTTGDLTNITTLNIGVTSFSAS